MIAVEDVAKQIDKILFVHGKINVHLSNGQIAILKEPRDVLLSDNEQSKLWLAQHYGFLLAVML